METKPGKLTGIDRKLQILNGIVDKVRAVENPIDRAMFSTGIGIDRLISEDELKELVEIGTARQELASAIAGINVSKSE